MEDSVQLFRLNSNSSIGDLEGKAPILIRRADSDSTILLGKLHCIVDQIPKDLLKSDGVGPDMVAVGAEVHDQIQLFFEDVIARDFKAVTEQAMGINYFQMEFDFSAGDAREVQQIID